MIEAAPTSSALDLMVESRVARPTARTGAGVGRVLRAAHRRRRRCLRATSTHRIPCGAGTFADAGGAVVVDMCCGSGAVGAAVLAARPDVELHAADVDAIGRQCARRNVGAGGQVYLGDLFGALPTALRGRVDVVVANVPYVPTDEIALLPTEARGARTERCAGRRHRRSRRHAAGRCAGAAMVGAGWPAADRDQCRVRHRCRSRSSGRTGSRPGSPRPSRLDATVVIGRLTT